MFSDAQIVTALNALMNETTLNLAIVGMQTTHSDKHLKATHTRPAAAAGGYGDSYFMKKKTVAVPMTVPGAWGKTITKTVNRVVEGFGQVEEINRADERRLATFLRFTDFGAIAPDRSDFVFFTEMPSPFVGFDMDRGKSLPQSAPYLGYVIGRRREDYRLITMYPSTGSRFATKGAKTIFKTGGSWSL